MTDATSDSRAGTARANLICMASMMMWAAGLPAADVLIPKLPPLSLTAARMALAAVALMPLWLLADGLSSVLRARWIAGILIGGGSFGLGAFLIVLAQGRTDAVTVAVISATMPVVGIMLEVALDGRRLTAPLVIGLALSLAGGLMALDFSGGSLALGWGALFALLSVVLFTVGSRLTVTAFPGVSPIGRTTITLAGAAVATVAAAALHSAIGGTPADWAALSPFDWSMLAFFAIGSLAVSQLLWINSVGRLGVALASLHINAAPFYVMLILFALGEPWNWRRAIAAGIVGLGVLVAQNIIPLRRG